MDSVARETILLAAEITHVCQTGKSKQGKAEKTYMHIKEIHFPLYTTTFKIGKGKKNNDFENILYFKENILKLFKKKKHPNL